MKLDFEGSRYHRQELITWWDQRKLTESRVLVVGAGAIGNEVVKNLALVGVGHISIVDMDLIEHSNLARCVFFRTGDEGRPKANVVARESGGLNPEIEVNAYPVPVQRLGVGFLSNFDLVIGALDNREARAWVNQACRKLGLTWIDAAIEGLRGVVRTFAPEGPCYECTLTEADYKQMSHRKSCALLAPSEMLSGKTPTNATTAGIVAGVQVQEAIKFLVGHHELMALNGKCWVYTGDSMTSYVISYDEDPDCMAHDLYTSIQALADPKTINSLVEDAKSYLNGEPVAVDFEEELIEVKACSVCNSGADEKATLKVRSAYALGAGVCSNCGANLAGEMSTSLAVSDDRLLFSAADLGLPLQDIITVRSNSSRVHLLIQGSLNGN